MISKLYLVAYNAATGFLWGLVLFGALLSLTEPTLAGDLSDLKARLAAVCSLTIWTPISPLPLLHVLFVAQYLACLEVLHSAVGLVRSPVVVTFMQVLSR